MAGICRMTIVGRLGRDPELRYSQNGKAYSRFSVAVNRLVGPGTDGERREETMWFSVVTFGALAERCANLSKGRLVFVEGRFETRPYENRAGERAIDLQIIANDVIVLDRPKVAGEMEEVGVGTGADEQEPDDLPF